MCCRTEVKPLDLTIARVILAIGQFTPSGDAAEACFWSRMVPEEGCVVNVSLTGDRFEASIQPSISTMDHHHGKRITAGVYFEICAKYAEKVGGEIIQKATVAGCTDAGASSAHVLAHYPEEPMLWDHICNGFRAELLGASD